METLETMCEELTNAKRGMGCWLTDIDEEAGTIDLFGWSDTGRHVVVRYEAERSTVYVYTEQKGYVDSYVRPWSPEVMLRAMDTYGLPIDVDDFEGEGEEWHDAHENHIETAYNKVHLTT